MKDQARARHQVEHTADNSVIEARRRHPAIRREPAFVLWPEPVHNEGKWATTTLLVRRSIGRPGLRGFAIRRRPRQSQHVKIELAWLALATVLSKSHDGKNESEAERDRSNVRQLAHAMSTHERPRH
jgi:hypothetical protein